MRVGSAAVGIAAAMSDPSPATSAYDGVQRRNHAAARWNAFDPTVGETMQIRFTIGDNNQPSTIEPFLNQLLQRIDRPHGAPSGARHQPHGNLALSRMH